MDADKLLAREAGHVARYARCGSFWFVRCSCGWRWTHRGTLRSASKAFHAHVDAWFAWLVDWAATNALLGP